jgi:ubiquinone/menaquinone biosynthesis C-methylase UbiE
MKTLKTLVILFSSFIAAITITFFIYTSFVDKLKLQIPEKTDFIHPSKLLIKYEVFVSGIILRPLYYNFVQQLNLTGGETILDFGSGAGGEAIHLADSIQNKNGKLTCLDISPTWLQVVKHRLSNYKDIDFIDGDITTKKIPDNSFDVIIVRLVLHDIPENQRKPVINQLYSILKPGGSVHIQEPIGTGHAIDEAVMRSLFKNAGFKERYFNRSFSFAMIPPHSMGMAAYDKK